MSADPHAPTPAGPDPDEKTDVHAAAAEPTPALSPSEATAGNPAGSAAPAPTPPFSTPDAMTPPGTPESEPGKAEQAAAQAQALTEKPEVMIGLAFVGGAALSLILKRFGR